MHHSDGDYVTDFGFCQEVTHNDAVPIPKPTTSVVDENNDSTPYVVADNRMRTVMKFADIVRGNHPPKSVASVNPVIPSHKKDLTQKNQVARFTLATDLGG